MQKPQTIAEYVALIPAEQRSAFERLRNVIKESLPDGFEEVFNYGMLGFVVPLSIYPSGYHCNPMLPLPFINLAVMKNGISLYHMGIYANKELLDWFSYEYSIQSKHKLDMGKSCIRFKKLNEIPFKLIGELASKISPEKWISLYEHTFQPTKQK